jgi:hypothetical protein
MSCAVNTSYPAFPSIRQRAITKISGLRLYQWAAIASIFLGGVFSAIGDSTPAPSPEFRWSAIVAAAVFGLFVSLRWV